MNNFEVMIKRLENFIRKFYLNELLKGLILFVAIGLLYFLFVLFVEHLLWLEPTGRTVLFWTFILVEVFLFGRFIVFPLLKLFKLSRGIDHAEASRIIGRHFPQVSDKLLNLLQLGQSQQKTDLLIASIDQKAEELKPVKFSLAVDFRKNLPYLKYAAIPILLILIMVFSGKAEVFTGSYERVINHNTAYEPPAPFQFHVHNKNLVVRENEPLTIQVSTTGRVMPQDASVHYNGQTYFMDRMAPGSFEYTFEPGENSFDFRLSGNEVQSREFSVEVIRVPKVRNLKMVLDYPAHTGLGKEIIQGTGNATVPEGTVVQWEIETKATEEVKIQTDDTLQEFEKIGEAFFLQKRVANTMNYSISTSNEQVRDFENLQYHLQAVKDEYPQLVLEHQTDSLDQEVRYFHGKASDDYGISIVRLVVEPVRDTGREKVVIIPSGKGNVREFVGAFPDTISLKPGTEYNYYFEVVDNDVLNGYKKVKSQLFSYRKKTASEEKELRLEGQREAIEGIDGSLEEMELNEKELQELTRLELEKGKLDYNDRKKLEDFLKRQKQQNQLIENFTEKLQRSLEEEVSPQNEDLKNNLEERLSNRKEDLEKNEKLLEELEKYSEKIQEEGLQEKLQELSKNTRNQERSLEQLLELTKKYYVQEKISQMSQKLEELSKKQEELSEMEQESAAAQDSLSKETQEAFEELQELEKENERLKKPLEFENEKQEQQEVNSHQEKAKEEIEMKNAEGAKQEQKKAAEKLKEMSKKMQQAMQKGGAQQMQEDATMLRQILDNLVTFSFGQEELMEEVKRLGNDQTTLPGKLRRQDLLRENFRHIDDSLYSLALRNEMIGEQITSKLIDVDYNLEKSLERLSDNDIRMGIGSQQYVITGANDLAYLLSEVLGNMEEMLSQASSSGEGKGQQLQDIIQKQQGLNEKMQEQLDKQKEGEGKEGKKGEQGEGESEELFEIYKEQQMLRRALEEKLKEQGEKSGGQGAKKEMEQIEKQLLEKGFNPQTLKRMQELEHRLLELEEAERRQGKKPERESTTGKDSFENETKPLMERAKEYFNTTEILNRQTLPLRPIYKLKVKEYFERKDD